jgi:uncharacterized protein (TIGR04255 family)
MIENPFGPPLPEIHLRDSPLVSVIAQVRFPAVVSIQGDPSFVAPFQEKLRKDYPILRQERQLQVLIGPTGGLPQDAGAIMRFQQQDPDGWEVTLAPTFVALSTKKRYVDRADFLTRLTVVLHALEGWLEPKVCDRIGIRFLDRISGGHLEQLSKLVRPEVLGVAAARTDGDVKILHALADTLFHLDDATELRCRWGKLPPGATYDPGVEAIKDSCWVLDLDHYTAQPEDFDLAAISGRVATFCDRIYRFFRWAVTDEFLRVFGAEQ